jgi:hypothetical protein
MEAKSAGERDEGVIIERRNLLRELVKLLKLEHMRKVTLVAKKNVLPLPGALAHPGHALEDLKRGPVRPRKAEMKKEEPCPRK